MIALCAALVLWALAGPISGTRPVGDGSDPTTYGFDLSSDRFDGAVLAASGHARDFLVALDDPEVTAGIEMTQVNRRQRGKEIVTTDRVVGLTVGGESRAYPLSLLNAHEIVNDTLGGVPIAVTFSPLADAPVVVDRRLGDRVAQFRVSGLVLDSTLLIYDAEEPVERRSLWSPLRGQAVSGPAAAAEQQLVRLPDVQLVAWRDWLATHPNTTVARRDPATAGRYKKLDYQRYLDGPGPIMPVGRMPPAGEPKAMAPMIVLMRGDDTLLRSVDALVAGGPRIDAKIDGEPVSFVPDEATGTVRIEAPAGTLILHGLWFALHSAEPTVAALAFDDRRAEANR